MEKMEKMENMTIQEMFDLLRDYRDAVTKLNNTALYPVTEEVKAVVKEKYDLAKEVFRYLPKFTPMHCKHCKYNKYNECEQTWKAPGTDYCSLYEVE